MPCYDPRNESLHSNHDEVIRLKTTLDTRTAMLCAVMTACEAEEQRMDDSVFGRLPEAVLLWWEIHKAWDERRKQFGGK